MVGLFDGAQLIADKAADLMSLKIRDGPVTAAVAVLLASTWVRAIEQAYILARMALLVGLGRASRPLVPHGSA